MNWNRVTLKTVIIVSLLAFEKLLQHFSTNWIRSFRLFDNTHRTRYIDFRLQAHRMNFDAAVTEFITLSSFSHKINLWFLLFRISDESVYSWQFCWIIHLKLHSFRILLLLLPFFLFLFLLHSVWSVCTKILIQANAFVRIVYQK